MTKIIDNANAAVNEMTLFDRLKSAVPDPKTDIGTHCSDIYVLKTPETEKIIKAYYADMQISDASTVFIDNITHRPFFDIPFGYMNEYVKENNA